MRRAVIVAGGRKTPELVRRQVTDEGAQILIAADSGMEVFYELGIAPHVIVGDFDSVNPEIAAFFGQDEKICFHELNPVKDDTDTEAAIRLAISMGAQEIALFGAIGTRMDHVLGNIELLGIGLKAGVPIVILDDANRIRMIDRSVRLAKKDQYGDYVSFVPYTKDGVVITLRGFKYPLDHYFLTGGTSLCISNEITADVAEVIFEQGILLMMETRDSCSSMKT